MGRSRFSEQGAHLDGQEQEILEVLCGMGVSELGRPPWACRWFFLLRDRAA